MNALNKLLRIGLSAVLLCLPLTLPGQSKKTVTGQVTDTSGEALPGTYIIEKGVDSNGTLTDVDGRFSIDVAEDAVLHIESLGFKVKDVPTAGLSNIVISLETDAELLEDAVVVGYGVQKKVNLTGAVSSISADEFADRPVVNVGQALQGVIPNLNITQSSGAPNASSSYNIRGNTSPNGGSPLILVDGVETSPDRINSNDIESISVLKDAGSAAIYGARGAFGVILITTKSGGESRLPKVSFTARHAFSAPTASTDFETRGFYSAYIADRFMIAETGVPYTTYTAYDYQRLWERRNDKTEHPDRPWVMTEMRNGVLSYVYLANFDWYHYFFDDRRPTYDYNINVNGGSKTFKYMLSGRYYHQDGNFRLAPDKFDTYNLRSKIDIQIRPWLKLSNNTRFYNGVYRYGGNNYRLQTMHALACFVPTNPDGTPVSHTVMQNSATHYVTDGYAAMLQKGKQWGQHRTTEVSTTTALKADIVKGLSLNADFTYKFSYLRNRYRDASVEYSMYPGEILQEAVSKYPDRLNDYVSEQNNYSANAFLVYENSWKDAHHFSATAGFNYEARHNKSLTARRNDLLSEEISDFNIATGEIDVLTGGINEYALAGFFYRVTYNWKQRYFIESDGRYDGSSRFPKGHQWGFFPSVSAAWRLSEEPFMAKAKSVLSNAKFRLSYGSLGNQNIDYYEYYQTVNTKGTMNYSFNGENLAGRAVISDPVSSGTWEKVVTMDAGLDLGFLNDRLTFTGDIYIRDTKGILAVGKRLPSLYGATEPTVNAQNLRTKGWEIQAQWKDQVKLAGKPFFYYVGASLADYKAWYTYADNPSKIIGQPYTGMRLGEIWGLHVEGLFKTDEEARAYAEQVDLTALCPDYFHTVGDAGIRAGDIKYADLDGDGILSNGAKTLDNPGDRKIIGNSQPRYSYSFNTGFKWLGIDFHIMFQGIGHRDAYPGVDSQRIWGPYSKPFVSFVGRDFLKDVWSVDNPNAYWPRPRGHTAYDGAMHEYNDRYLQNAAYLRLKNLTVGYTLPDKWTQRIHLSKIRVYFSGENLWYWTALHTKYVDPELVLHGDTTNQYAMNKTFSFGVNVDF